MLNTRVRPSAARGQRTPATITRHGHMLSNRLAGAGVRGHHCVGHRRALCGRDHPLRHLLRSVRRYKFSRRVSCGVDFGGGGLFMWVRPFHVCIYLTHHTNPPPPPKNNQGRTSSRSARACPRWFGRSSPSSSPSGTRSPRHVTTLVLSSLFFGLLAWVHPIRPLGFVQPHPSNQPPNHHTHKPPKINRRWTTSWGTSTPRPSATPAPSWAP